MSGLQVLIFLGVVCLLANSAESTECSFLKEMICESRKSLCVDNSCECKLGFEFNNRNMMGFCVGVCTEGGPSYNRCRDLGGRCITDLRYKKGFTCECPEGQVFLERECQNSRCSPLNELLCKNRGSLCLADKCRCGPGMEFNNNGVRASCVDVCSNGTASLQKCQNRGATCRKDSVYRKGYTCDCPDGKFYYNKSCQERAPCGSGSKGLLDCRLRDSVCVEDFTIPQGYRCR